MENKKENIVISNIENVLHSSMIPYAEHVILERALPRVEDGLKPVQRRILYAMNELGLTPDKPHKKSARVVGECLAKYHPHGDSSVYEAMVRLAQPFNMRMTLVDGQGNFGSVDGDGAAAMRYTEAKLNNLALEMLKDLDKDTVDWENNFDDSLKEPKTLPSRFPNVLVNGGMGIAVGLATNIPPHNLGEVIDGAIAYINNPRIKLSEMMKYVPGPDFPTGGFIIAGDELEKAYETGKGKILIRSKLRVEQDSPTKQSIVVDEIPFQVNKASLIQKIGQLMVDKKEEFGGISDVVDESDRHGMRIVIKLKKDVDASDVLDLLYKNTNLQVSYGINLVMIADGKPQQLGLLDIFKYYTEYQKQVVLRRTKFDLSKAKLRHEIVSGLIIAVTDIDRVIQIIKKSPDTATAKQNLRKQYDLSDVQAQAILDLKLSRLTRLEIENLKEELKQLEQLIKELTAIIESKKRLNEVVVSEMTATKKTFKEIRKTTILTSVEETKVARFDDEKP
ncbi:MAG: DNA topoisomerase 4 subunit A, partial [Clostridia bacterium]|nr:DNA topoisomerase 4 subunit A [Clostridia bacterium]